MNASRALAAEQTIALAAGITSDLVAQGDQRGLPRPRFLIAVFAFYGILGVVAAFGRTAARIAVAAGGVAALTTLVVGPGGLAIADLFRRLSGLTTAGSGFATAGSATPGPSSRPGFGGSNLNPIPGSSAPITGGWRSAGVQHDPITGRPLTPA